jgi:hypothetical protein
LFELDAAVRAEARTEVGAERAESDAIAAATGNPMPPYSTLRPLSLQGREAETTALIEATIQGSATTGFGMAITAAQ